MNAVQLAEVARLLLETICEAEKVSVETMKAEIAAGNIEAIRKIKFYVDGTMPTITATLEKMGL